MPATFTAHSQFLPWYALLGMLWSTLILEMPAVRYVLKRNFLANFFLGFLAHLMVPAIAIGLGYVFGWGKVSNVSPKGFTLSITHSLNVLSPAYLLLCGGLATVILGFKTAFFYRLAVTPPRAFAVALLGLLCFVSTTLFLTSLTVDRVQLLARVVETYSGKRLPAGTLDKKLDPLKAAAPLLKYYQDLNLETKHDH